MIVYRIITILVGGLFLMQAVNWILDPQSAANGLEMELLEGAGRSTQVGDMTAFFFGLGLMVLNGARPGHANSLYGGVLLLGGAAVFRSLAWLFHGAEFATRFITVEVVATVFLLIAARQLSADRAR